MAIRVVTFLPWIILNVLPSCGGVTCSETAQCEHDYEEYAKAQVRDDVKTLCNLLGRSVDCMELAMNDCQKHSNFPDTKLQQAQDVLERHKKQVLSFCPHLDRSIYGASGSETSGIASTQKKHDTAGITGVPTNPSCPEMVNCGLDLEQFRVAIKENRLTEACGLIKLSVRCLHLAISDCKETKLLDKEDIANATRWVTGAEALFDNYCGQLEEDMEVPPSVEISEEKQKEQRANHSTTAAKTIEQIYGHKTNGHLAHKNKINGAKGIHDGGSQAVRSIGDAASVQIMSLLFNFLFAAVEHLRLNMFSLS